jgi:hypothetical protein
MYRWSYSWEDLRKLYIQKQKEEMDKTNAFCTFLVELTSSALGGGKSDNPDEVGLDTGEGMDDITDEQLDMWRSILTPKEFDSLYGKYV